MADGLAHLESILAPRESRKTLCEKLARVGLQITPKTLANMDCSGKGIADPIRWGKIVYYSKQAILDWVYQREHKVA